MHPLQNGSQVVNKPAPTTQGVPGYFTEEGAPSWPGADWFNACIAEFQNMMLTAGITFNPSQFNHLALALKKAYDAANAAYYLADSKMAQSTSDKRYWKRTEQVSYSNEATRAFDSDKLNGLNKDAFVRQYYVDPGSTGGQRHWVRLFTLKNSDAGIVGELAACGDYGDADRALFTLIIGSRAGVLAPKIYSLNTENQLDKPEFYYVNNGPTFTIWAKLSDYNQRQHFTLLNLYGGVDMQFDNISTVAPENKVSISINAIYNLDNKPTKADVGLEDVINAPQTSSVTDPSTTTYAVAKGVKTAYDKAVEALNEARLGLPTGIPLLWPESTPPTGYLECRGQAFNKTTYPQLAAVYPKGILLDLRGEFIRGWDHGRGVDAGRAILSQQAEDIKTLKTTQNMGRNLFREQRQCNGELVRKYYSEDSIGSETRPRNIAFMYIVRAA